MSGEKKTEADRQKGGREQTAVTLELREDSPTNGGHLHHHTQHGLSSRTHYLP